MNPVALHHLLVDLEAVERWEATAGVRNTLSSWVSEGSAEKKSSDAEVQSLANLLVNPTVGDSARHGFIELLLASEDRTRDGAERDPDWRRALAAQRRRRAITGRAGAVLAWLQASCVPGMDPAEVCRRCADRFAPPGLLAAWRAEVAPRAKGAGKVQPKASIARHAYGHELVAEAVAVWCGVEVCEGA